MAENSDTSDKTEEPSQHRLDQSRSKGEVASSKELASVLMLSSLILTVILSGLFMFEELNSYMSWLYAKKTDDVFTQKAIVETISVTLMTMLKMLAPIFGVAMIMGVLSHLVQTGFVYAPDVLSAKFERLNPINGFKRIFSMKSVVETVKSIAKFVLVFWIGWMVLKNKLPLVFDFLDAEYNFIVAQTYHTLIMVAFSIIGGLTVLALLDFGWEKYSYMQKLRMTKKEVRDESKEREGSPEIKQKIKAIQREMARKRMMKEIPKADVIVVNPTHYSVAIKYNKQEMLAPVVIAKGVDHLALKIREIAKDHNIPIIENVMLARNLYANVALGESIPKNLYKAVAEVLAFVYKLKKKDKAIGVV